MIRFESDYARGAHPDILKRLCETNNEQYSGYGRDDYTESAKRKIRQACQLSEETPIYFLTGGTQTNALVIGTLLKSHESVLSAETGHIVDMEAGAIEYTGHKVVTLPQKEGKMQVSDLLHYLDNFYQDPSRMHKASPGMVYISYPTELGTLYTKDELAQLSKICRACQIPLYIDGARLAYGLAVEGSMTLADIAQYADVFYIGGTKVGALCGEAVVFAQSTYAPRGFERVIKQHGALLAKGRLLSVQFDALFTDNLLLRNGQHAVKLANQLKETCLVKGYSLLVNSPTNQQFIVLPNAVYNRVAPGVSCTYWQKVDEEHTAYRFIVDWSTTQEELDTLCQLL